MQSVVWEFARMRPDYQFLVEPWSIRGFEIVHGQIYFALGLTALISFLLVWWEGSQIIRNAIAIIVFMIAAGTFLAARFSGDPYTFTPGAPVIGGGAIILGVSIFRFLKGSVHRGRLLESFIARLISGLVIIGIVGFIINALIGGQEQTIDIWVGILAILILLGILSIATTPRELAANRMLMYSTATAALAMALSAGAVRSTLFRLQAEAGGVPAQYKDTQVTSGHLIGVFGMLLVTAAAVMLWAKRRDAIQTATRAAKQRAAAEESAREIEEAIRQAALLQEQ